MAKKESKPANAPRLKEPIVITLNGEITQLENKKVTTKSGMNHKGKLTIMTGSGHKVVIESGPEILQGRDRGQDVTIKVTFPQTSLADLA